jgi:hypothetical protein
MIGADWPVLVVACEPVTQPGPALLQQPSQLSQEHIIVITCDRPFHQLLIYPPYLCLPVSLHHHPLHHHQSPSFSIVNSNQPSFILYSSAFIHCHSLETFALVGSS